ncbi:hypothetical protein [Mediterraneibacter agrestimuris]|uniref:hypothetical protein n=1 Tax=Mediterraneibacter agrestimuris TaxID=2941333 RepID=UPI002041790D|nr:hypothetical protein [Mediterraneibacter agrestimuris]
MLDKRRIRLMARMSAYEKNHIKQDLKISTYYKKDYASLNTLITLLWITVGYVIVAGLYALCNMDAILKNLDLNKLFLLVGIAVGVYLMLVIIYCVCASSFYKAKHNHAKQRVKKFYRDLARLEKMDIKENR